MDHLRADIVHGRDHTDPHLDDGRWRHQESSSYARHASPGRLRNATKDTRAPKTEGELNLATYLDDGPEAKGLEPSRAKAKFHPTATGGRTNGHVNDVDGHDSSRSSDVNGITSGNGVVERQGEPDATDLGAGAQNAVSQHRGGSSDGREVRCGPLLNYRRMDGSTWRGSVLIVVRGGGSSDRPGFFTPTLLLSKAASINSSSSNGNLDVPNGSNGGSHSVPGHSVSDSESGQERKIEGVRLYSDPRNTFWRFTVEVEMSEAEGHWAYRIPGLRFPDGEKTDEQSFFVPAVTESMRIMFHSCNGFSVGTDEESWSGAALWNDVMRKHKEHPFHVMLGGGDQIYNDGIRVSGPLRPWTDISNPRKRRDYPFPEKLRKECDDYYVSNYIRWYSTEPFAGCNGKIPQLNLWDDHDIIDGFGSYVDDFMKCDVFRGIGGCAYKYYMLFQHHLAPPVSTYTTDAPQTMSATIADGVGVDAVQMKDTFVLQGEPEDSSYIIGPRPGPYVAERSRSIYAKLGARIAFFGIDARTERTRHQVNYPETYDLIFNRLKTELASHLEGPSPIQHLVVLLGIPIAYPRLTWLENIFSSPLMGPIKFLNKRVGFGGGFFNSFDGSVDVLDDLDDHYTAGTHKRERHDLIIRLQELAAAYSVRITILGGDVHLAALGRFYSNPKLNVPIGQDHRYMANVISSAIVNKPPPQAVANLLAKRNKLHHLDENTDETLLKLFDKDPGKEAKTSSSNHVTMPSRNWAMLTENSPSSSSTSYYSTSRPGTTATTNTAQTNGTHATNHTNGTATTNGTHATSTVHASGKDGHHPLHIGEETAGTKSRAADDQQHGQSGDGALDVMIRVERDQHDKEGKTTGYGLFIPTLQYEGSKHMRKRDAKRGAVAARTGRRTHE